MYVPATTDSLLDKSRESVRLSRLAIRLTWQAGPWLLIGIVAVLIAGAILAPVQLALVKAVIDRAAFDLGFASNAPAALGAPSLVVWIGLAAAVLIAALLLEPVSQTLQSLIGDRLTHHITERLLHATDRWQGIARFEDPAFADHLLSARLLADEILVLNHGKIVERGDALRVIRNPQDDYTQLLLRSISNPYTLKDERVAS